MVVPAHRGWHDGVGESVHEDLTDPEREQCRRRARPVTVGMLLEGASHEPGDGAAAEPELSAAHEVDDPGERHGGDGPDHRSVRRTGRTRPVPGWPPTAPGSRRPSARR